MLTKLLHAIFGLSQIDRLYDRAAARQGDRSIWQSVMETFGLRLEVAPEDRSRIPVSGPVVAVANHPTGGMDGIVLAALLDSVRSDVKTMSHVWFGRYRRLSRSMFLVDPGRGPAARRRNRSVVMKTIGWVARGGMLTAFPAGEVARFRPREMRVSDAPWQPGIVRLVRATHATVLPVHIEARNGLLYHLLSLLHPRLGALLLIRELLNKRGKPAHARIGRAIPFEALPTATDERVVADYLRLAVEELGGHVSVSDRPRASSLRNQALATRQSCFTVRGETPRA